MTQAVKSADRQDLIEYVQELEIKASPEKTFEGLIKHLTDMQGEPGNPSIKLTLERRPGGRWFRDLGNDSGHLWGFVQAIKPPTLLEIFGPLMLSYPVACHLMVRLSPIEGGTKLVFRNEILGPVPPEFIDGMGEGWGGILKNMKKELEG
jgi:uncharacterized protein YndB with AHSA1/START domain